MKAYVVLKGNGKEDLEDYEEVFVKTFYNQSDAEEYVISHNNQIRNIMAKESEKQTDCKLCEEWALIDKKFMHQKPCFQGRENSIFCKNSKCYLCNQKHFPSFDSVAYTYIEIEIE